MVTRRADARKAEMVSLFDEKSGVVVCNTPWGRWWQTVQEVNIEVDLPVGTRSKEITVSLKPTEIKCIVKNEVIFEVRWSYWIAVLLSYIKCPLIRISIIRPFIHYCSDMFRFSKIFTYLVLKIYIIRILVIRKFICECVNITLRTKAPLSSWSYQKHLLQSLQTVYLQEWYVYSGIHRFLIHNGNYYILNYFTNIFFDVYYRVNYADQSLSTNPHGPLVSIM